MIVNSDRAGRTLAVGRQHPLARFAPEGPVQHKRRVGVAGQCRRTLSSARSDVGRQPIAAVEVQELARARFGGPGVVHLIQQRSGTLRTGNGEGEIAVAIAQPAVLAREVNEADEVAFGERLVEMKCHRPVTVAQIDKR